MEPEAVSYAMAVLLAANLITKTSRGFALSESGQQIARIINHADQLFIRG